MDELLENMLPKEIATRLKNGQSTPSEYFESASIMFVDIIGFTTICSESTPQQIISFLNGLYSQFDSFCESMDIYKVETVGDAYMTASGVPTRNGIKHAEQIATAALLMIDIAKKSKISHLPKRTLHIRAGMCSGPVVAGIIGSKKPSYCLFGNTVNVAARMETASHPLRLLTTDASVELLSTVSKLRCMERGLISIKGKGSMMTYWVTRSDDEDSHEKKSMWTKFDELHEVLHDETVSCCDSEV